MTNTELGELIEIGLAQVSVDENPRVYLDRSIQTNRVIACAWGLALIGYEIKNSHGVKSPYTVVDEFHREFYDDLQFNPGFAMIAEKLGVDYTLADRINTEHVTGRMTASSIINALKSGVMFG